MTSSSVDLRPAESTHELELGIGFNWMDYFGMGGLYARSPRYPLSDPVYPDLADEASWSALFRELDELRPGVIRFGLPPDPHVDADGGLITDTVHLSRLERLAQWAARAGSTIILDTFTLPTRFEAPRPSVAVERPMEWRQMAALDNRALAREFTAPLLKHIKVDRGMVAVRYFNPVNEPMLYGVYRTALDGPDQYVHYVDMYRELREALDEVGLPETSVGLLGVDCVGPSTFPLAEMVARGVDINPFIAAYSIHFYYLRFDYLPQYPSAAKTQTIQDAVDDQVARLVRYCRARGRPLFVTEIGTFYYGWRDGDPSGPARLEAVLTVAESVIRGLNVGLDGFAFWTLMNPNTIDGHWSTIHAAGGRVTRVGYRHSVFGALTRLVRPGATVTPLVAPRDDEWCAPIHVHGTALMHPVEGRTALFVNDDPIRTWTVRVRLPPEWSGLPRRRLTTDHARLGVEDRLTAEASNEGILELPPMSFTALTD